MIALVDSRKTRQRREPDKERTSNIGLFVTERFPAWAEALRPRVPEIKCRVGGARCDGVPRESSRHPESIRHRSHYRRVPRDSRRVPDRIHRRTRSGNPRYARLAAGQRNISATTVVATQGLRRSRHSRDRYVVACGVGVVLPLLGFCVGAWPGAQRLRPEATPESRLKPPLASARGFATRVI